MRVAGYGAVGALGVVSDKVVFFAVLLGQEL